MPLTAAGNPPKIVSPVSKPKPNAAGLSKPSGKKAENPKSPSPPPTRAPDVEMPDIAAGEETEDSDTVVVARALGRGKGKEPAAAEPDGSVSPPPRPSGKGSVKMVIGDKKSSASASASPPLPPPPLGITRLEDETLEREAAKPAPVKKTIGRIGKIGGKKVIKKVDNGDAEMKDVLNSELPTPSSSTSVRIVALSPPMESTNPLT